MSWLGPDGLVESGKRRAVKSGLCTFRYVPSSRRNAWPSRSGIFRHVVARRLTQGRLGTARRGLLGYRKAWQSRSRRGGSVFVTAGSVNARQSGLGRECPGGVGPRRSRRVPSRQRSHGRHVTVRRVPSRHRKAVRSRQGPARTGPSSRVIARQRSHGRHVTFRRVPSRHRKAVRESQGGSGCVLASLGAAWQRSHGGAS